MEIAIISSLVLYRMRGFGDYGWGTEVARHSASNIMVITPSDGQCDSRERCTIIANSARPVLARGLIMVKGARFLT